MARCIELNHDAIQALLDGENGVKEFIMKKAKAVLASAEADAASYRVSGDFTDGLEITAGYTDRLQVRIGSNVPYSHAVEAKHGTMARALDAAGGS